MTDRYGLTLWRSVKIYEITYRDDSVSIRRIILSKCNNQRAATYKIAWETVLQQFKSKNVPETSTQTQESKMKFALAILLVLAVASPLYADQFKLPPSGSGALAKELQEFIDLVPLKKMIGVTKAYYHNDREFKLLMSFMRTPELKRYILDIENAPETKELMNYVEKAGLDIYRIVNIVNKILNLAPVAPMDESEFKITGGIEGYIKDVGNLTSFEELETLYNDKMENSKVFIDYVKFVAQPRYVNVYLSLHENQNYLKLKEKVVQSGIDGRIFDTYSSVYIVASFMVL